jgi:hypothetical protein
MQPSAPQSSKKHKRDRGVWVGDGATVESMMNEEQFRKRKISSIPADQVCFSFVFHERILTVSLGLFPQVLLKETSTGSGKK